MTVAKVERVSSVLQIQFKAFVKSTKHCPTLPMQLNSAYVSYKGCENVLQSLPMFGYIQIKDVVGKQHLSFSIFKYAESWMKHW